MSLERRNFPQFFITAPAPCPYIEGRIERKVFTHLISADAEQLHNTLSHGGFRRSQNIAYRPSCDYCTACVSVRVLVDRFKPGRTFRRTLRNNRDICGEMIRAKATQEQFSLFRGYIDSRHSDGGMADMTALDYAAMVDESFVDTRIVEYRFRPGPDGNERTSALAGVALTDVLEDGLSMIYSFFDAGLHHRGLGTFMILDHIERARKLGLPYVYLGFWIEGARKMSYKGRFLPQQRLTGDGWQLVEHR